MPDRYGFDHLGPHHRCIEEGCEYPGHGVTLTEKQRRKHHEEHTRPEERRRQREIENTRLRNLAKARKARGTRQEGEA